MACVSGKAVKVNLLPTKADFKDASRNPLRDLVAGFTVAIVALPLALAFGIASGLGAEAGLTTAIVAGALAAIFGGSRLQVSGPTGAMTVVLMPIFHNFGAGGVLLVGLMAGILLTITAFAGIGEQVHRLPTAVVEGFTAGLAIVIALQQFPFIFGVQPSDSEKVYLKAGEAIASATFEASTAPVLIAIGVAAAILLISKIAPRVPSALIMVFLATLTANTFGLGAERIGDIPSRIGNFDLGFLHFESWWTLIPSAVAVAVLAALESLLSAKVADQMRGGGERHDSNRELFGQGMANIVVPFLGGVPATAALARTAVNVRSGASSKLAALSHSAILAAVILLLAPVVAQIPLAALGGVLIATCVHMIKPTELLTIARDSWLDVILLVATFALTIFVDMITAIVIGILLALLLRRTPLAKKLDRRYPPVDEKETLGD